MAPLWEYAFLTFGALFAIVDPVAAIPGFLAMTARDSVALRQRMAFVACLTSGGVLALFAALGPAIFKLFGITLPAFQIAGGLIMLLSSLDMLRAKRTALKETVEETEAGASKDDIAITPLAIPMLSGPGAISTAVVLSGQAKGAAHQALFYACIAAVSAASYFILWSAATGSKRISPIAMNVMARLMGLLLAAVGVQFIMTGLKAA
jgi:multiple antibiotic resistance protein